MKCVKCGREIPECRKMLYNRLHRDIIDNILSINA